MGLQETFDYLMQIQKKEYAIRRKELRCRELEGCLMPGAVRYDRERVQASPSDKTSEILLEIASLETEIEKLKHEKARLVIEIGDTIELLPDDIEKTVLSGFYISRKPMSQVADMINYSVRRTYYFRKQGVIHLGEVLDKKSANIAETDML